jgi:hypothetical protein
LLATGTDEHIANVGYIFFNSGNIANKSKVSPNLLFRSCLLVTSTDEHIAKVG